MLLATTMHQVTLPSGRQHAEWLCLCDCGGTRMVPKARLTRGTTTHCGCLHTRNIEGLGPRRNAPEYNSWVSMRNRCNNPRNQDYHHYGGRGIRVSPRWGAFKNFYTDMGPSPAGFTLDRIDSDGNYEPGNCRWADSITQNNNSRNCRRITLNGETLTLTQWAARLNIGLPSLIQRLKNWPLERALTTPKKERK